MKDIFYEKRLEELIKRDRECQSEEEWIALEKDVKQFVLDQNAPEELRKFARWSLWEHCGMMVDAFKRPN